MRQLQGHAYSHPHARLHRLFRHNDCFLVNRWSLESLRKPGLPAVQQSLQGLASRQDRGSLRPLCTRGVPPRAADREGRRASQQNVHCEDGRAGLHARGSACHCHTRGWWLLLLWRASCPGKHRFNDLLLLISCCHGLCLVKDPEGNCRLTTGFSPEAVVVPEACPQGL